MTSGHEAKERAGYRYWQEKGSTWAAEYDRRKESIPLYHVQELMLATYLSTRLPPVSSSMGAAWGGTSAICESCLASRRTATIKALPW